MDIQNKTDRDPVVELPMIEAYMRCALMAAEAEIGDRDLNLILRDNKLERFISNYPPDNLKLNPDITISDYAIWEVSKTPQK